MNVTAISENGIAHPGNRQPNNIVVSVTNQNGEPVSGLGASNFEVGALIVAPFGALVVITRVAGLGEGYYLIEVVPVGTNTWKSGTYIFGVTITRAAQKGQTLDALDVMITDHIMKHKTIPLGKRSTEQPVLKQDC
jgi:hypothetical protein